MIRKTWLFIIALAYLYILNFANAQIPSYGPQWDLQESGLPLSGGTISGKTNFTLTLNHPTDDEQALSLNYTINKAAGNTFGFIIDSIHITSPGYDYPLMIRKDGTNKFGIDEDGFVWSSYGFTTTGSSMTATAIRSTTGTFYTGTDTNLVLLATGTGFIDLQDRTTNTVDILNLGDAAVTSHGLGVGDILVGDNLEIEGETFHDGGVHYKKTIVNAATYSILPADHIIHVTYTDTGTVTLTLDTDSVVDGHVLIVKDADFNANNNTITIGTEGAETIDEQATATITTAGGSLSLYCDGSNWFIF